MLQLHGPRTSLGMVRSLTAAMAGSAAAGWRDRNIGRDGNTPTRTPSIFDPISVVIYSDLCMAVADRLPGRRDVMYDNRWTQRVSAARYRRGVGRRRPRSHKYIFRARQRQARVERELLATWRANTKPQRRPRPRPPVTTSTPPNSTTPVI